MKQRNSVTARLLAFVLGLVLGGMPAYAASADHRAVAGDFNGDGWTDLIFQPLPGYHGAAEFIAYADGNFGAPAATWPDKSLGTDWNAGAHRIVVGDWNGDGRADLILQGAAGLASQQYLAAADGSFSTLTRTLPATLGGLDPSQAGHGLVVGDFNGDGRADLLLQADTFVGTDGIALAGADGKFAALAANWDDGMLGLGWSADRAALAAGDFDGDGRAELLVRAAGADTNSDCCRIVAFDKTEKPRQIVQTWTVGYLGVDWEPATHRAIVGDLNGDGRADLLVQPDMPGDDLYVLLADADGRFTAIADHWPSERDGVDWSAESYLLVPEKAKAGKGATLAMIPQQTGLLYRRARFDKSGHLIAVTVLSGPSDEALAALGANGDGKGDGSGNGIATTGPDGGHGVVEPKVIDADTPGAMGGGAGVANGTATYSIPIVVPPGRAGMAPSLSLAYSSSGGDGHEGVGWSLGGLSAIYRCPATFASDGHARGTEFNSGDRFCLDGAKLMVTSGNYGAAGSVYHAEVNGFAKVAAVGSQGSGPQSFTVTTPDGDTLYYGSTSDSRLANPNASTSVFTWALAKSVDADGNEVDYQYHNAGGEYYPTEIDYTLHDGGQVGAMRKVVFGWDDRDSIGGTANIVHYIAGMKLQTTQILTSITTSVGGANARQYTLDYHQSPATNRPLLDSVQECAWDAGGYKHCLPAATFDYQGQHAPQFSAVNAANVGLSALNTGCAMSAAVPYTDGTFDVNGDGLGDATYVTQPLNKLKFWIQYGAPGGFEAPAQMTADLAIGAPIDFNLDGRTDIIKQNYQGGASPTWNVSITYHDDGGEGSWQSDDTAVTWPVGQPHKLGNYEQNGLDNALVGDVNGDGKPDLITYWSTKDGGTSEDHLQVWLAQGTGDDTSYTAGTTFTTSQWIYSAKALDYDADGRTDLLVHYKNATDYTTDYTLLLSNGSGFTAVTTNVPAWSNGGEPDGVDPIVVADVNGDSLPDILEAKYSNGSWSWMLFPNQGGPDGEFGGPDATGIPVATITGGYPLYNFVRTLREPDGRTDLLVPTARTWFAYALERCINPQDPDDCQGEWIQATPCSGDNTRTDQTPSARDGYDWELYRADGAAFDYSDSGLALHNLGPGGLIDVNHDGLSDVVGVQLAIAAGTFTHAAKAYKLDYSGGTTGAGPSPMPDLMSTTNNGFGVTTGFTYQPIANPTPASLYQRGADAPYPEMRFSSPMQVVATMSETNPAGGQNTFDYSYEGAGYNVKGRGFLGFATVSVEDEARGTTTATTYHQDFPYIGRVIQSKSSTGQGTEYQSAATTWANNRSGSNGDYRYVVYASHATQSETDPTAGGATIRSVVTTQSDVNACGHPGSTTQTTDTQQAQDAVTTGITYYGGNPDNCWQNTVHIQTVTRTLDYTQAPATTLTTTATYTYWDDEKVKTKHVEAPHGGDNQPRDWSYAYDGYGNPTSVTQSADGEDRTTTSNYGSDGYFPVTVTNALGQSTHFTYDPASGNKTSATDANGIETDYAWHAFGRSAGGTPAGASAVAITYLDPGGNYACPAHAAYVADRVQVGYPESYTCTDAFGHELRSATKGFDGSWIYVTTTYTALGQVYGKSVPYYAGDASFPTHYLNYDVLDRPAEIDYPNGRTVQMSYVGLTTHYSDAAGGTTHIYAHTWDGLGEGNGHLVKVAQENDGATLVATYRYDAGGNLVRATDAMGNAITATYDGFGDKLALDDPDKGNWSYGYDGFGEQTTVTNARGKVITSDYDALGRKTAEHDPADQGGRLTTWTYDTYDGIGQVASETVQENANAGGDPAVTVYRRTYGYDTAGRATASEITVGGTTYLEGRGYDVYGRPEVQAYPAMGGGEDQSPTVSAEADPPGPVASGATVELIASGSDPDGWGLSYHWTQSDGPAAQLSDADQAEAQATLPNAGTYYFKVTASDGFHHTSRTVSIQAADPPTGTATLSLDPETSYSGSYTVSWTAVDGATSYRLLESKDDGNWLQRSGEGLHFSWQATDKDIGSYRYQVQGCSAPTVCGSWSARVTEMVSAPSPPPAPTATPQTSYEGSFQVNWNDVAGATSYTLEEQGGPGDPTYYNGLSASQKSVSGRAVGDYTFRVKSCSAVGCGSYSGVSAAVSAQAPPPPDPPTVGPSPSYDGHYTVSWGGVAGAGTYDLNEKHGGSWSEHDGLTTRQWATSKTSTGTWTYEVRGCNETTGCGAWSGTRTETVSAPEAPPAPTFNHNPTHNGSYTVHWNEVSGADWYDLNEKQGNGSWSAHNNLNATQWSTTKPDNGTWSYEVRGCNTVTGCGAWSAIREETVDYIPATPTGFHRVTPPLKVYPDSTYTLSWEAPAHAVSYDLNMDGWGATQTGITGTSKDETAPGQAGDDVSWQVRACNGNAECSDWSSPAIPVLVSQRGGGQCPPLAPDCQPKAPAGQGRGGSGGGVAPQPHTVGDGGTGALLVTTTYNAAGYATTLTRASDGMVYGTIQAMDAWGHATQVHEANGVTITRGYSQVTGLAQSLTAAKGDITVAQYTYDFDGFGNLTERDDVFHGASETEHYDDLNRLTKSILSLAGGGGGTTTYTYDDSGNLKSRSDRGTYSYGAGGAGPHAVTSISDGSSFSYNENGEMLTDGERTLAWQDFGQVASITQGATVVSLDYDAENQRYQKTVSGATEETVLYLGAAERLTVNGQASIRRTLSLADLTIVDTGGANAQVRFVASDPLGSTVALTQSNGGTRSLSYGPFGRRMTAGWAGNMSPADALTINTTVSDRGYTGQEGLDAVGLWDYNARLYDPALGRFLSVDPLIAHPESTQGINPYSYVENNPLNRTDPTGEADGTNAGMCQTEGCMRIAESGGVGFGGIDWNVTAQFTNGSSISGNIQQMAHTSLSQLTQIANNLAGGALTLGANGSMTITAANSAFDVNTHSQQGGGSAGGGFWSKTAAVEHNFGCGFSGDCSVFRYQAGAAYDVGGLVGGFLSDFGKVLQTGAMVLGTEIVGGGPEDPIADAAAFKEITSAARGTTSLFRAVSPTEFEQLTTTNVFRAGPNSLGGKFFAETPEHAMQWGTRMEGAGNFRVIEAQFPKKIADSFMRWDRLDGIGPARYGELEQINSANPTVVPWP